MNFGRTILITLAIGSGLVCTTASAQGVAYDLTVRVAQRDGAPAAGLHVRVFEVLVSNRLVQKFDGNLPVDGTVHIAALNGGARRPVHRIYAGPNEEQIDTFRFEGPDAPAVYEVQLPLMAGDPAPDGALLNILTGERGKLSDYRGQIVYLDFWGTWCLPCRQAMLRNEEAMKQHAKKWNGKAAIVALSVDEDPEVAKAYAIERGWTHVIQVWNADSPEAGWETQLRRDFGIDDIPRAVLIGKDGTILWRGDPNQVDPEKMIDDHLR